MLEEIDGAVVHCTAVDVFCCTEEDDVEKALSSKGERRPLIGGQ